MNFYRLESSTEKHYGDVNCGVYYSDGDLALIATESSDNPSHHPMPHEDRLLNMNLISKGFTQCDYSHRFNLGGYVFGFSSLHLLYKWFYCLDKLSNEQKARLQIGLYNLVEGFDHCLINGTNQSVAHCDYLERIGTIKL